MQSQRKNRVDLDPSESCGVGCIVSLGESQNPDILKLGLTSLANVAHRGAIGADGKTGDGCGVMTDIPSDLLCRWLREANIVSDSEWIGVGCAFLPTDAVQYQSAIEMVRSIIDSEGMKYLGLREVPTESACLGSESRRRKPNIVQFFVSAATDDPDELDRRLFIVRRYIELNPRFGELDGLHIASLSCRKNRLQRHGAIGCVVDLVSRILPIQTTTVGCVFTINDSAPIHHRIGNVASHFEWWHTMVKSTRFVEIATG